MTGEQATVVDLFSGAGGLSLGFQAAGARILAAVDASEAAGRTFRKNFDVLQSDAPPRVFIGDEGDIEDLDIERIARRDAGPDILVGGPPCQGFSRVGRAKLASLADDPEAGDPRNELYHRFVGAARFWRPSAVVMENVVGMLSVKGENVAEAVCDELAGCGYRIGYAPLNAAWYGVPQFRERLFFVALREDLCLLPSVPDPTHRVETPSGYLRPPEAITLSLPFMPHFELEVRTARGRASAITVSDALDDLPRITEHLSSTPPKARPDDFRILRLHEREPTTSFAKLMRRWPGLPELDGVRDHAIRRTPRDFETFRRMRPDDRYPEAMPIARERFREELARRAATGDAPVEGTAAYEELRRRFVPPYPEDRFVDKWRKLNPDRPSWTVPAHLSRDAYSHIHHDSEQARAISVREAARLQSFPDAFEFVGNMGDCFTQIGNAVPPVLAWVLADHILRLLGRPSLPCPLSVATRG
ncbi:DNA cytosine methyltransferase [Sorangium sp. So ce362]|uniref:DNA cytosine methyltransferase n=1 Tax=Sorangium sp. So ce362 TaxID=3133303 RepID=UPI003F5FE84C